MFPYWPMDKVALEKVIPWEPHLAWSKEMRKSWVRVFHSYYRAQVIKFITNDCIGIIPRAASALFDKLEENSKAPSSSIRAPSRLSGMQSFPKPSKKSWTMVATYVEVRKVRRAIFNIS
jgi:hypothetical protein